MGIKSNYKQAYFYNVFDRTGSDILPVVSIDATGGTITTPGDGYKYHFITAPCQNFVVSDAGTTGTTGSDAGTTGSCTCAGTCTCGTN